VSQNPRRRQWIAHTPRLLKASPEALATSPVISVGKGTQVTGDNWRSVLRFPVLLGRSPRSSDLTPRSQTLPADRRTLLLKQCRHPGSADPGRNSWTRWIGLQAIGSYDLPLSIKANFGGDFVLLPSHAVKQSICRILAEVFEGEHGNRRSALALYGALAPEVPRDHDRGGANTVRRARVCRHPPLGLPQRGVESELPCTTVQILEPPRRFVGDPPESGASIGTRVRPPVPVPVVWVSCSLWSGDQRAFRESPPRPAR